MSFNKHQKIILSFDLDNTLIDNRQGIVNSFNYALKKYELAPLDKLNIESMIGLPLNEMFSKVSNSNITGLSEAFREYYKVKGIYEAKLLQGVRQKLKEFDNKGFTLGVITSKKQEMAEKVVELLNIKHYFDYIYGETEERKELGKLDPTLKNILIKQYPNTKLIVIGDHPKDVLLSNNLECPFIGVLTGNYSSDELKQIKRGKILILNSLKDLTIKKIYSLV